MFDYNKLLGKKQIVHLVTNELLNFNYETRT